jgi:uncharacterized membrane protein
MLQTCNIVKDLVFVSVACLVLVIGLAQRDAAVIPETPKESKQLVYDLVVEEFDVSSILIVICIVLFGF